MKIIALLIIFCLFCSIGKADIKINRTCIDNTTLQIIEPNVTEVCAYGCDNVTNTCNPPSYQTDFFYFLIMLIIIIGFVMLYKFLR